MIAGEGNAIETFGRDLSRMRLQAMTSRGSNDVLGIVSRPRRLVSKPPMVRRDAMKLEHRRKAGKTSITAPFGLHFDCP